MRYVAAVTFEDRTMDDYWRFRQGYADEPIDGLILQVGGTADAGMRIISIWESKADHDHFITERLHPVLQRSRHPSGMTVTDFTVDNLLIGPAMPLAHRPTNTVLQDENSRSTT